MPQRIVVALGGNALQKNGETSAEAQKQVARDTAAQLVQLIKDGNELIIVHGNGPQVGQIVLNEEAGKGPASPLDTCGAMSQGEIGYWLQQALGNELRKQGLDKPVATIVTQIVVDRADPAFQNPTKPIGRFYPDEQTAQDSAVGRGITVKEDAGRGWRRVVASPMPQDIVEKAFISQVLANDCVVIAAGGGGIPVIEMDGSLTGVEAVIDKDFAGGKLAELVDASVLLILTGIDAVTIHFRTPQEQPLGQVTTDELQQYIDAGHFAPGSMLPKVQAALQFVQARPGNTAIITSPQNAVAALRGGHGTRITQPAQSDKR